MRKRFGTHLVTNTKLLCAQEETFLTLVNCVICLPILLIIIRKYVKHLPVMRGTV